MERELCLITGVGPATGKALVERFAERYRVAMVARDGQRLEEIAQSIPYARGFSCDVADSQAFAATLGCIESEMGSPSIIIHNAVGGGFGDVLTIDPTDFERYFRINAMALLQLIQTFGNGMAEAGTGAILATGNTAAYRGREQFASFAPSKAAQRILLESTARLLWPKGVHVAYVAIDAAIDTPRMRKMLVDKPNDFFCHPADIAEECYRIAHQSRSAWAFEVMIRPYGESW